MACLFYAPGHVQYIPEGLSKIILADLALVVVYLKENLIDATFHNGQLKEHVLLCKISGIDNNIVAVNKMDLVGWSKESFQPQKS